MYLHGNQVEQPLGLIRRKSNNKKDSENNKNNDKNNKDYKSKEK